MSCSGEQIRMRTLAIFVVAVSLIFPILGVQPAEAADTFDPSQMIFPLISDRDPIYDSFSDCRSGCARTHGAIDIMRDKLVPVVAVADGTVSWQGTVAEGNCCYVYLDHPGGYKTGYIHLNNDSPGTDDGLANGIAEGIVEGAEVKQGQLIGWVGDSGNAESAGSHLHFEIRYYGNGFEERINPYPYLLTAPILDAPLGNVVEEPYFGPTFVDDNGSPHEQDIERLVELGVTNGCSETEYCPTDSITRGQMAAFVRRYHGLDAVETDEATFADTDGHLFAEDIEAIMSAGMGFGCSETDYCPDEPLKRNEMAKFLFLAFDIAEADAEVDAFVDDDGDEFEDFIDAISLVGVTTGCTTTEYCPTDPVTREQMASFFIRSYDLSTG